VRLDPGPGPRADRAIAAYLGGTEKFGRAIAEFAETYADLTEQDHAALSQAAADGRA